MMYATELALSTNVSVLRVPLHCYHGHLSYSVLDTTEPTGVRQSPPVPAQEELVG
jgi:hypothetical protein